MNCENKVAVVGCGYWGQNLVRNFAALDALAAVCDNNTKTSFEFSQKHNVPAMSFSELMSSKIKAVAISSPAELHYELALEALEADKNVYVEKPLALFAKQAEKLCKLAEEKGLKLMVGHLLQYHPAFLKLKSMVSSGELGKIRYIYSNRLSLGKIRREENSLWSFAPHDISMILALVGEEPNKVSATGAAYLNLGLADVTMTHLSFPNGVCAHVFVSWLHPFKEQKLVVVGSEGMAVFHDNQPWESKIQHYAHKININADGIPVPSKADKKIFRLWKKNLEDRVQTFH